MENNYNNEGFRHNLMKGIVNDGKYVCIVCDHMITNSHAIVIDCDERPKLIWDAYDFQALELNETNLGKCCGNEFKIQKN